MLPLTLIPHACSVINYVCYINIGLIHPRGSSFFSFSHTGAARLVADCGKMRALDMLLKRLREEDHRCLIFTQMTKMLDILEDYMVLRQLR